MNETRTIAEIDNEIAMTKEALASVRGTETEVYARIVGYYRSVRNWNKGKRDEYNHRKQFVWSEDCTTTQNMSNPSEKQSMEASYCADPVTKLVTEISETNAGSINYEFFGRTTCPNCPPVKNYLASAMISGVHIDVDTDEGLARASEMGVFSAPTVILFTEDGKEIGRGHTVAEITELFALKIECVA